LYAEITIAIPAADKPETVAAYQAFASAFSFNPRAESGGTL
jgi:hypothetical protein